MASDKVTFTLDEVIMMVAMIGSQSVHDTLEWKNDAVAALAAKCYWVQQDEDVKLIGVDGHGRRSWW